MNYITESHLNPWNIQDIYNYIEQLRDKLNNSESSKEYYNHLKNINRNDILYGWMFSGDAILTDTLETLDLYQDAYVREVLICYKNELENILIKAGDINV